MQVSRTTAAAMVTTAALAGSVATGVTAFGHEAGRGHGDQGRHRGAALLDSALAPSVPSDPALHGAAAGGAPWVLNRGHVKLRRDGRLRVDIRGLVIPSPPGDGTPGPVMTVSASLYCGDSTTAAGTTAAVPISRAGNARIRGTLSLPSKCLAPVVLVHPNGGAALYIAADGFGG